MNNIKNEIKELYQILLETDRLYADMAKKFDLSNAQQMILYYLEYNNVTQKELSLSLFLPKQTVNTILMNWCKLGYLNFVYKDGNKKEKVIEFTNTGKDFRTKSLSYINEIEDKIVRRMGKENMKALIDTNKQYLEMLREEISND